MSLPRFTRAFKGMLRGEQYPELCASLCVIAAGSYVVGFTRGVMEYVSGKLPEDQKSCLKFKWINKD